MWNEWRIHIQYIPLFVQWASFFSLHFSTHITSGTIMVFLHITKPLILHIANVLNNLGWVNALLVHNNTNVNTVRHKYQFHMLISTTWRRRIPMKIQSFQSLLELYSNESVTCIVIRWLLVFKGFLHENYCRSTWFASTSTSTGFCVRQQFYYFERSIIINVFAFDTLPPSVRVV